MWLLPAAAVLAADQGTKAWVAANLPLGSQTWLVPNWLSLTPLYNSGAAFNLLLHQALWLGVIGVVAAAVVAVVAWRTDETWIAVTLGLLLGGILGNLIDRLMGRQVLDFIKLPHWPAFNVADMAITVAAVVLVVESWLSARTKGGTSHQ
ncbi:MAG: signal peptidase II [Sulfobacillus sp.]